MKRLFLVASLLLTFSCSKENKANNELESEASKLYEEASIELKKIGLHSELDSARLNRSFSELEKIVKTKDKEGRWLFEAMMLSGEMDGIVENHRLDGELAEEKYFASVDVLAKIQGRLNSYDLKVEKEVEDRIRKDCDFVPSEVEVGGINRSEILDAYECFIDSQMSSRSRSGHITDLKLDALRNAVMETYEYGIKMSRRFLNCEEMRENFTNLEKQAKDFNTNFGDLDLTSISIGELNEIKDEISSNTFMRSDSHSHITKSVLNDFDEDEDEFNSCLYKKPNAIDKALKLDEQVKSLESEIEEILSSQ